MQSQLKNIAERAQTGDFAGALTESKKSNLDDPAIRKVQCYLLLKNGKYPEADTLAGKLIKTGGLDHELLLWRGVARAELGLWLSALRDLRLSADIFPTPVTDQRIEYTTRRACQNISEGMVLDGGSFNDFADRARIYLMARDYRRAERDIKSAAEFGDGERSNSELLTLARLRSEVHTRTGNFADALTQIEKVLAEDKDNLATNLFKARIKSNQGKLRAGLAILRAASKSVGNDEESMLRIADCKMQIRDFHGAIRIYNEILSLNSNSTGALFGRGQAHYEIRLFDEAIEDFELTLKNGGANPAFLTHLGEAKLAKAADKDASRAFKDALKIESRYSAARLGYAKVKNFRGKRTEALKIARDILKKDPDNPDVLHFQGVVSYEEKDFVQSIEFFTKAIENTQDSFAQASNYYRRGTAHLEHGHIAKAIADLNRAHAFRPFHVGTLVWRGYAHGKMGQWANAISDLQAAIDMNPMAATQYKKLGEFIADHSIQHYGQVLRDDKQNAEAYYNRGMANLFLEQNDKAYLDFEQALKIDPAHSESQVRMGTLFLKDQQAKKAYNFFSDGMKSTPSATTLLLRAEAMLQMGVIQPALVDIRDAIRTAKNNDRLYVRRGELYAARGVLEKALDDFTLSIALNFDNFQAFRERGRLFVKRQLLPEAIYDFSMSLHFFPAQPDVIMERGNAYLQLGENEKAAEDFAHSLTMEISLEAYLGRARALASLGRGQEGLIWITKAIHRFKTQNDWAQLIKVRAEIFLELGRFERASADARMASKLVEDQRLCADCYYIRALASYHHRDREHAEKSLVKAVDLDPGHADAELALDWMGNVADQPPKAWQTSPEKIRPTRPALKGDQVKLPELSELESEPPFDLWIVRCGDEEFGPVPVKTVGNWIADGRVSIGDSLFRTDWGAWKSVAKVFPGLSKVSQPDPVIATNDRDPAEVGGIDAPISTGRSETELQ